MNSTVMTLLAKRVLQKEKWECLILREVLGVSGLREIGLIER